jgi:hypothetical protein
MATVTRITQKLHSDRLAKNYPRVKRENNDLSTENITDEMAPFCPPQTPNSVCVVVKENPFENLEFIQEIDLQDTIPYFNSLLMYRILKLSYETPDILAAIIDPSSLDDEMPIGKAALDWGYTVQITDDSFAEVRSIHNNTRFKLRYWMMAKPIDSMRKKMYGEKMAEFLKAFADCIEKNAHLFDEREDIDDESKSTSAFSNVFAEKYYSAIKILDIARKTDHLPEKKDIAWEENISVNTAGSLYLSSAILFVISLETLVNTIYHLLLKTEFGHEAYERATIRADLDVRIISTHLFCDGFDKPILTPGTDLWHRVLKLRKFRNDVFHGNITPDHHVYVISEDIFAFFYGGIHDFRGRRGEEKAKKYYPTTMPQINLNIVSEIKETVDQIISAIKEAANHENSIWIDSWLWDAMIPKFKK